MGFLGNHFTRCRYIVCNSRISNCRAKTAFTSSPGKWDLNGGGRIKCGNAMDIRSGPPSRFCPLNVFSLGSSGSFVQKVDGLILIRTANHLLFSSAGRPMILKSAEGKLQQDGHLASHYPTQGRTRQSGRRVKLDLVFMIPPSGLIHQKRMSRHFMTDNILAGQQFDRFMFTMRLCRWARPHAMECHKDLIKEITLIGHSVRMSLGVCPGLSPKF